MLTTLQRVKYYLQIDFSNTEHDWILQELIEDATDSIEAYCGRKFAKNIYTEEVKGAETLWVKNTPILDILELVDESGNDIECRFTPDKVLIKKPKTVSLTGGVRLNEPAYLSYTITYEGGYESIPAAISKVATEMVILSFEEIQNETMSIKSRSEGSVNQSYIEKAIIHEKHKPILDNYKIIRI